MAYTIEDLDEAIEELQEKRVALEAGEEFCNHHWNGSDSCYECYCTGCGTHIAEIRDEFSVPFKKDAYCYECTKTPEEKEREARAMAEAIRKNELAKLRELQAKYPDT